MPVDEKNACPHCGSPLAPGAVLCVQCGYHLKEGRVLGSSLAGPSAPPAAVAPSRGAGGFAKPLVLAGALVLMVAPIWVFVREHGSKPASPGAPPPAETLAIAPDAPSGTPAASPVADAQSAPEPAAAAPNPAQPAPPPLPDIEIPGDMHRLLYHEQIALWRELAAKMPPSQALEQIRVQGLKPYIYPGRQRLPTPVAHFRLAVREALLQACCRELPPPPYTVATWWAFRYEERLNPYTTIGLARKGCTEIAAPLNLCLQREAPLGIDRGREYGVLTRGFIDIALEALAELADDSSLDPAFAAIPCFRPAMRWPDTGGLEQYFRLLGRLCRHRPEKLVEFLATLTDPGERQMALEALILTGHPTVVDLAKALLADGKISQAQSLAVRAGSGDQTARAEALDAYWDGRFDDDWQGWCFLLRQLGGGDLDAVVLHTQNSPASPLNRFKTAHPPSTKPGAQDPDPRLIPPVATAGLASLWTEGVLCGDPVDLRRLQTRLLVSFPSPEVIMQSGSMPEGYPRIVAIPSLTFNAASPLHPLVLAAWTGDRASVSRLLAEPRNRRFAGPQALAYAVARRDRELIGLLLQAGVPVNAVIVEPWLTARPWSPLVKQGEGEVFTPLLISLERGDLETAQFLLDHGANPDLVPVLGVPALHQLCRGGKTEAVEFLLGKGANPDLRARKSAKTALYEVLEAAEGQARSSQPPLVQQHRLAELLVAAGADPDRRIVATGNTARDVATRVDPLIAKQFGTVLTDETRAQRNSSFYLPLFAKTSPAQSADAMADDLAKVLESRDIAAVREALTRLDRRAITLSTLTLGYSRDPDRIDWGMPLPTWMTDVTAAAFCAELIRLGWTPPARAYGEWLRLGIREPVEAWLEAGGGALTGYVDMAATVGNPILVTAANRGLLADIPYLGARMLPAEDVQPAPLAQQARVEVKGETVTPAGERPVGPPLWVDNRYVVLWYAKAGRVECYDADTMALRSTYELGQGIGACAITSNGLVVQPVRHESLLVLDPVKLTVRKTIPWQTQLTSLAGSPVSPIVWAITVRGRDRDEIAKNAEVVGIHTASGRSLVLDQAKLARLARTAGVMPDFTGVASLALAPDARALYLYVPFKTVYQFAVTDRGLAFQRNIDCIWPQYVFAGGGVLQNREERHQPHTFMPPETLVLSSDGAYVACVFRKYRSPQGSGKSYRTTLWTSLLGVKGTFREYNVDLKSGTMQTVFRTDTGEQVPYGFLNRNETGSDIAMGHGCGLIAVAQCSPRSLEFYNPWGIKVDSVPAPILPGESATHRGEREGFLPSVSPDGERFAALYGDRLMGLVPTASARAVGALARQAPPAQRLGPWLLSSPLAPAPTKANLWIAELNLPLIRLPGLPAYTWVGECSVTRRQFDQYLVARGLPPRGGVADEPATGVTLTEAEDFCDWLTRRLTRSGELPPGLVVLLPNQYTWSRCVRCDHRDWFYPWGPLPPSRWGNYDAKDGFPDPWPTVAPVTELPPNEWGLRGMGNNIREWASMESRGQPPSGVDEGLVMGSSYAPCQVLERSGDPIVYHFSPPVPASTRHDELGFRISIRRPNQ